MNVLVTGGAGYIGSVVVEELLAAGHVVVVYDNLTKGHRDMVAAGAVFVQADLREIATLRATMLDHGIEGVVHMAADSLVGESVVDPRAYYANNVGAGLALLDTMLDCGVRRIVFSSTAAVYGEPLKQPIEETDPTVPTNPYGETKLALERALGWYGNAYGLRHASLRYFNAAGASERCGERHDPETHLIPIVLEVAAGVRPHLTVNGTDYPTHDGTCVRDYIHVIDLASAHVMALTALEERNRVYNLGCGGAGYSVMDVIQAAREVTGRDIPLQTGPRRAGDPPVLVAASDRIRAELGWSPRYGDLHAIIESAWTWMGRRP